MKDLFLMRNILFKRPVLALWQVTGRCDFRCRICRIWRAGHSRDEELSIAQAETVLTKLHAFRPMLITLAGGEPTLREDLPLFTRMVSRNHYSSIITNGYRMDRSLARELFRNGLRDAMVSLDYAVPERHDEQRGIAGAFDHAIRALEHLRDARGRTNHVRILTVLMDDNLHELEGLLLIAKELSVSLSITRYSDHLGKQQDFSPRDDVAAYLLELKRRHPHFDSATRYLAAFDQARAGIPSCGGGARFMTITPSGGIARCIDRYDMPAADALTESSSAIRRKLLAEQHEKPCTACWTSCRGLADIVTGLSGIRSYGDFLRASRPQR